MHFIKLFLLAVAWVPTLAFAQVQVVGFEIGVSTMPQVKSQLAKQQAKIQDTGMRIPRKLDTQSTANWTVGA